MFLDDFEETPRSKFVKKYKPPLFPLREAPPNLENTSSVQSSTFNFNGLYKLPKTDNDDKCRSSYE